MGKTFLLKLAAFAVLGAPMAAPADLYVTDFTALIGSTGASGVWRNLTTGTALNIPVSLTQTGGEVLGPLSDNPSDIDDSTPWVDIPAIPPFIPGVNVFEPNFNGDSINVETPGGSTSVVTIRFNAQVVDPVISFSDVDTQTTMHVSSPFTVVGDSGNISADETSVKPDGTTVLFFDEECAGSLRVDGVHTELIITLQNAGPDPDRDDDRTSFVVSTQVAPEPANVPANVPVLSIALDGLDLRLSWPADSGFSQIRWSANLAGWEAIPGLDPAITTSWSSPISELGDKHYFQGVVVTPAPPP